MSDPAKCPDPAVVEKANLCGLGKWIYGDGEQLRNDEDFEKLRALHVDFHRCAARVIRSIKRNDRGEAEEIMSSDYARISGGVISMLVRLRNRCP